MNALLPAPRLVASYGKSFDGSEKPAPDEGTSLVTSPGQLPQLIAMRDVLAWWQRENRLARGGR